MHGEENNAVMEGEVSDDGRKYKVGHRFLPFFGGVCGCCHFLTCIYIVLHLSRKLCTSVYCVEDT